MAMPPSARHASITTEGRAQDALNAVRAMPDEVDGGIAMPVVADAPSKFGDMSGERETQREGAREPARDYYRRLARWDPIPDGHLKYHIDPELWPEGCRVLFVPVRVNGMDSGQLRYFSSRGWVPARACDFPAQSGFGAHLSDAVVRGQYAQVVNADDVVERDGQMLFVRVEELCARSERDQQREAKAMVNDHLRRLQLRSDLPEGKGAGKTEVTHGKQFVNSDVVVGAKGEI
jgi:hypothetical protein